MPGVDVGGIEVSVADAAAFVELAAAFRTWPKPPSLFDQFAQRSAVGEIVVLAARVGTAVAGYCLVDWRSTYPLPGRRASSPGRGGAAGGHPFGSRRAPRGPLRRLRPRPAALRAARLCA